MRRPHALLALSVAFVVPLALAASLGVVACGGNDKPPLTPDNLEPATDSPEAGATPAAPPAK
jgi:hypothetical protein